MLFRSSDTLDEIKWLAESKKLTMGTSAGVYMLYGSETNLKKYNKDRWNEIYVKILGIDALNRAALFENKILKDFRLKSLKLIHKTGSLRNIAISSGLGY